jgi:hypothetical protein
LYYPLSFHGCPYSCTFPQACALASEDRYSSGGDLRSFRGTYSCCLIFPWRKTALFALVGSDAAPGQAGKQAATSDTFSENGVGKMLFPSARSEFCRRMLFDNRTGKYYEASEIFCGQAVDQNAEPDKVENPSRLSAVRKSFQR